MDWNRYYWRLVTSDLHDPRFHADQFGRQPVRHILAAIEWLDEQDRRRANLASHTTAQLASLVLAIGSGGKGQGDYTQFLPFLVENIDGRPRLPADALATLHQLIRQRRLPMPVIALLADDLAGTLKPAD